MIRYRNSKQDDPIIMQLIESQLVPLSHLSPKEIELIRKDIPTRLQRGVTFVASPSRKASSVAFVHFMLHGELLFIDMLAVEPAAQRKRWGKSLMEYAENFAVSRGCKRAKVMVDWGNHKGLSFYQKMGYQIVRIITPNKCYELEKNLALVYQKNPPG
ncbi:GNAT family N-acetyltransferase [Paenibacillus dakarensis]|uniref:GNAT family N-acetyltransferase n=1 Tax=Paenibacillus dakarensis TaxID=1527293 RepID=UPI0006D5A598|nr:GNAT family N-acetyltransferase [Paenibacillus dakarensis]